MLAILQSAMALGAALAINAARRAAAVMAGLLLAAALLVASLGFFTFAAYRALSHAIGDVYALVIIGCGYFVASLIALLVVQLKQR
jgi:hypothetical protein